MDCKEFEKMIPLFINQKMDFLTTGKFCEHMKKCPGCSEELEIQFLVAEGMQRLEEGDAFDLQNELQQQLQDARRRVRFHMNFMRLGALLEVIVVLLLAGGIVWMLA